MGTTKDIKETNYPKLLKDLPPNSNVFFIAYREDLIEMADYISNQKVNHPVEQGVNPTIIEGSESIERPISQSEAIKLLGKTRQTFINWRRKGIVKAYKMGGRIFYKPSELMDALKRIS